MNPPNKEIKKLVIARLDLLSKNKRISVGSAGEYSPDELIQHVKDEDPIGKKFIEIEMSFLRAMKEGLIP